MPYRTLGFPEYGMANASNFTRGFTPASNPERGNSINYGQRNGLLFMLKGPRLKTVSYRTLGLIECGMVNASNFTRGFTPASTPERGNNIGAMKWAFIYVKRAKAKTVSYRTLGFPEYGMANASNFMRGFTPASNPERGNNIGAMKWVFIYDKRAKGKNGVISYLRVDTVRIGQCKQFHARGNGMGFYLC